MSDQENVSTKKKNGFANWDPEKLRALCSKAGKACNEKGKRPSFTSETARAASLKANAKRQAKKKDAANLPPTFAEFVGEENTTAAE